MLVSVGHFSINQRKRDIDLGLGNRGWYTLAFGASTFMFRDLRRVRERGVDLSKGHDSYELLARRAILTLITMERWNAAGTSTQTMISDDCTKLVVNDKLIMGDMGYCTLRK